jgi:hypothetical protein
VTTTNALAEALRRDAAVLLDSYRSGAWVPDPAERELAEGLTPRALGRARPARRFGR